MACWTGKAFHSIAGWYQNQSHIPMGGDSGLLSTKFVHNDVENTLFECVGNMYCHASVILCAQLHPEKKNVNQLNRASTAKNVIQIYPGCVSFVGEMCFFRRSSS